MRNDTLASGPGWSVSDVVCGAGPHDRPFEECHGSMCIAVVTQGTFQYRSAQGTAVLAPGALLLGNAGTCFECGHEHAVGDRCLSFHFAPGYLETIATAVPGARHAAFAVPRLPPLRALMPLVAAAEAARDTSDGAGWEELTLGLGGAVLSALADAKLEPRQPSRRDERRVTDALRRIEAQAEVLLTVADLAEGAAMSPYHFLRVFTQVAGMTPHQFVLRTRLHRAAVRLRRSKDAVLKIALEAGFNDLSTFNRQFRKIMRASPGAFRAHESVEGQGSRGRFNCSREGLFLGPLPPPTQSRTLAFLRLARRFPYRFRHFARGKFTLETAECAEWCLQSASVSFQLNLVGSG